MSGGPFGPIPLPAMHYQFEDYRRAIKLAEYNRNGQNPSASGKLGEIIGARLQAKADRLAHEFPAFPEYLKKTEI